MKIGLRLSSGELIAKNGFCVVAPIRMTVPSSTSGSSTSCWALLKRCSSSTKRIVRWPAGFQLGGRLLQHVAHFLGAGAGGVEAGEAAVRLVGDDVGQGRLAGAGRAVEDQRAEPVGREQPAEQLAGAEEVLLADELVERPRPHARGQRLGPAAVGGPVFVEQVDG